MIEICLEKNGKIFANHENPDQKPHSAASDLSVHCLQVTNLGVSRLKWVKVAEKYDR